MNDVVQKKSRKKLIAVIAGGAVLVGSIAAYAGARSHWHHGKHMDHAVDHISQELELDDTQRTQLESLGKTLMEFKRVMRDGTEANVILASVQGTTLDQTTLNGLIESKLDAARAQTPQLVNAMANFYDGLNTEQQAEARARLERAAQWMEHRKGEE
ncbi:MAG: Spy/CpxP family protein refolding chaperone [Pseudomonadota bacterium]